MALHYSDVALSFEWTFWYVENCEKSDDWKRNTKQLFRVSTAAQFIDVYTAVKLPSALSPGASYCFFKKGITPVWEEGPNKGAGAWKMLIANKANSDVNLIWSDLLFVLISDGLGELSMYLCGITCNVRKNMHKITLWTVKSTPANHEYIMKIGKILLSVVRNNVYKIKSIKYELHENNNSSNGFNYALL